MDKKIMKLLGVCLFAVASVGVLTACSDNDAENPEGGKPGGEDVNRRRKWWSLSTPTWCTGEIKTEWAQIILY